MCDARARAGSGVVCTAIMPRVTYPLQVLGTALANGTQGQYYRDDLVAEGGRPRYTFTIQEGSLPHGLRLSTKTGDVAGKPRASGTYEVTIEVTDSTTPVPRSATQTFSLQIASRR